MFSMVEVLILMCDFADAIELQSWTCLFVCMFSIYIYESEVRNFYYNANIENDGSLSTKVGERRLCLYEEVLSEILKVPREGIRSAIGKTYSKNYIKICRKMPNLNTFYVPKKFPKEGYQLFFEFVNKVLLP